jgi:hypothetical protein
VPKAKGFDPAGIDNEFSFHKEDSFPMERKTLSTLLESWEQSFSHKEGISLPFRERSSAEAPT